MAKRIYTRREIIYIGGLGLASASLMIGCKSKNQIPIGVQLYQVRHECEKDFAGTLTAIAKMGYDGVEFYSFFGHSAMDIRKMLDDNGLRCCGAHTKYHEVQPETLENTIEFNKIIGSKCMTIPSLPKDIIKSKSDWEKAAEFFYQLSKKLRPHKMVAGYHCHDSDFAAVDGSIPWEIIAENTPDDFVMQMDTGNCMRGGGNPVKYMKKYPGRTKTIHLKEYSETNKKAIPFEGDVNWEEVFELCRTTAGTEWYIIEEEKNVYPPMKALKMIIENYRELKI